MPDAMVPPLLDVMQDPEKLRARLTALPPSNPSFPDHVLDRMLALTPTGECFRPERGRQLADFYRQMESCGDIPSGRLPPASA